MQKKNSPIYKKSQIHDSEFEGVLRLEFLITDALANSGKVVTRRH